MLLICTVIHIKDCKILSNFESVKSIKSIKQIFSFPYDFESTPGYEITYALNCIYNVYLATYFAACDLFFVNCGLHLISATFDLEDFFKEIDKARKDELFNKSNEER